MNLHNHYRRLPDILLVCAIVLFSGWIGWKSVGFLQDHLTLDSRNLLSLMRQAVLFGTGQGMGQVDCTNEEFPALEPFLAAEIGEIPASAYPRTCSLTYSADPFLKMHYYLFYYVGWSFRLMGVSVRSFHVACLFLFILSVLAAYCLFRLAAGPLFAAAGALLIASSPAFLVMMPSLRDFGKTPFIILSFFLIGVLVRETLAPRRLLLVSCCLGAVIGVGYGFRQDLIVCLPPALFIAAAGAQTGTRHVMRWRAVAAVVLCAAFVVAASPVLRADRSASGATSAHTLIQGSMRHAEDNLGLHGLDYDFGYKTLDPYIIAAINAYALRAGHAYPAEYMTAAYGESGKKLFLETARTFPADMFKRGLLAVIRLGGILNDDYITRAVVPDVSQDNIRSSTNLALYRIQHPIALHFSKYGVIYGLFAIAIIAAVSCHKAFLIVFLLFYFGAYPNLLYEFRHYFQTIVIFIFLLGIVVTCLSRNIRLWAHSIRHGDMSLRDIASPAMQRLARACAFLILMLSVIGVLLIVLGGVQKNRTEEMLSLYAKAQLTPVAYTVLRDGEKVALRLEEPVGTLDSTNPPQNAHITTACLAMRFREAHRTITFGMTNTNFAFERPCSVVLRGSGTYFFPVYNFGWEPPAIFQGLEMKAWDYELLEGIYVVDMPGPLLMWPHIQIPDAKNTFLAYKPTALDALKQMAQNELASGFGFNHDKAMQLYEKSIWKYQHSNFFIVRALHHASRSHNVQTQAELWKNIGAYVEPLRSRASQWFVEQAATAQNNGCYDASIRLSDVGGMVAPYDVRHWEQKSVAYEATNNMDAYRDTYCQIMRKTPEAAFAAQRLDAAFAATKATDDALAFFRVLASEYPDAVVPTLYVGIHLERQGNVEDAERAYETILDTHPDNQHALYRLGILRMMNHDLETGIDLVQKAVATDQTLSGEIATRCAETAKTAESKGDYETALLIYELAASILPEEYWFQVRRAELFELAGNPEAAKQLYEHILLMAPESPYTAEKLAALYKEEGNIQGAIEFFRELAAQNPNTVTPQLYSGIALERNGHWNDAVDVYTKALTINKDNPQAMYRLGAIRMLEGDLEVGKNMLAQAVKNDASIAGKVAERCGEIADHFIKYGQYDTAQEICSLAMEIAPDDLWHLVRLGDIAVMRADIEEAVELYLRVLMQAPESPVTAQKLNHLADLGKLDKNDLVMHWRNVVNHQPEALTPVLNLAIALESVGNIQDAITAYQDVLRIKPDSSTAIERIRLLQQTPAN